MVGFLIRVSLCIYRVITIEEQREVAKELIKYFKEQALLKSSRTERCGILAS